MHKTVVAHGFVTHKLLTHFYTLFKTRKGRRQKHQPFQCR